MKYFALLFLSFSLCAQEKIPVRLGVNNKNPIQSLLVHILKTTKILQDEFLTVTFTERPFDKLLLEMAKQKRLDMLVLDDFHALQLHDHSPLWVGIAKVAYQRQVLFISQNNKLKNLAKLKGAKVVLPVGKAPEWALYQFAKEQNIPFKEFALTNALSNTHESMLKTTPFKNYELLVTYDPIAAHIESKNLAKKLLSYSHYSLLLMDRGYWGVHPHAGLRVTRAFKKAYDYFRENRKKVLKSFLKSSYGQALNQKCLEIIFKEEKNFIARNYEEVRMLLLYEDKEHIKKMGDFYLVKREKKIDLSKFLSNQYIKGINQ